MNKCPYCAEKIQDEAIICRYCGRDIPKKPEIKIMYQATPKYIKSLCIGGLQKFGIALVGAFLWAIFGVIVWWILAFTQDWVYTIGLKNFFVGGAIIGFLLIIFFYDDK